MTYDLIVSDWNGTLFRPETSDGENREIAYAVLWDTLKHLRISEVWGLLNAKKELKAAIAEYKKGSTSIKDVYEIFNNGVVNGSPEMVVRGAMGKFATESAGLLDERVLIPVTSAKYAGKHTGILSVSCYDVIRGVLKKAGYDTVFDPIVSNKLEADDGCAVCITSDIHGEKAKFMESEYFSKLGFSPEGTLYMGDSKDDAQVAEMLPRGHFIVPFLAGEAFRKKMASSYGAFVPESMRDLHNFFQKG